MIRIRPELYQEGGEFREKVFQHVLTQLVQVKPLLLKKSELSADVIIRNHMDLMVFRLDGRKRKGKNIVRVNVWDTVEDLKIKANQLLEIRAKLDGENQ